MDKNKTATLFALFLMFAMAVSLVALPAVNAHTPAWEIPTHPYISVAPNPVGVGQQVLIVVWIDQVIAGVGLTNNIRFHDYKLTITKPDETTDIIEWPIVSDPTSSAYTPYTPDQAGTYTLKFEFPEQEYTWTDPIQPIFGPPQPNMYTNDTYLASSAETTLTVQEEQIEKLPEVPLPTEYWTRPIEGENFLWDSISSNWLGGAANSASTDVWQKDGSAPRSPHIMWSKLLELGGLTGGMTDPGATYYAGFSYETRFNNPLIISGILYYQISLNHAGSGGGYAAVDLRTGEEIWTSDYLGGAVAALGGPSISIDGGVAAPSKAQLYNLDNPDQHGVVSGILWQTVGSTWNAYDAFTGKWIFNLTGVPSGTEAYTDKGEIVRYVLNYNSTARSGWLALWNNTAALLTSADVFGIPGWRPLGQTIDASTSDAYSWNVTITADLSGSQAPTIVGVIPGDLILGRSSNVALTSLPRGTPNPWTMWAISDKPESRGQLLWIKNYPAPEGNITRMLAWQPIDPVAHAFTMTDFETGLRLGYGLDDGTLLWGPLGEFRAFQYYSSRKGFPAYGNLYVSGYGGEILCFSMKNGTLLWKYNNTNSGIETPWGLYPIQAAAVADGVIYAIGGEHSPNKPLYKGYRVYAVDAFTGEELWTLLGWSASGLGTSIPPVAIADGFLVYLNAYDGKIYCVGKGPSATTVTASPKVSVHGSSVLVEGMVIDTAAGTKQDEQVARFPDGVPAVSDESMTDWMEYVYMQKPRPANATGVEVVLTVLDPNNNSYEVGRTTSDANGMFHCAFTPEVPGEYTIIATFEGSEGYWPSHAETAINVEEVPAATPAPTPTPAPMTDTYVLGIGSAILIAVIIGFALLLLRKR